MNILFSTPFYKPAYEAGGPAVSVPALAEALARKGHRVVVATTNGNLFNDLDIETDCPIDVDGIEVWYFRRKEFLKEWLPFVPYLAESTGYFYAPKMARQLDLLTANADIVHTHLPFSYPVLAAARASRRHRKPLFYEPRGAFAPYYLRTRSLKKIAYIRAIERPIMQDAFGLIALTKSEEESFRRLKINTKCHVIPNGVSSFLYRTRPLPKLEDRFKIPPEATVILFMSRLKPVKGPSKLLECFARIQDRFPDIFMVLAGPDQMGHEIELRNMAESLGLGGRVLFPGMVSGSDKLDLLARADLFCLPSEAEGFSVAVLEALASGTPVLISTDCNFSEVEAAGVGRVITPDTDALTHALENLLGNRAILQNMAQGAREFVERNFSWDEIAERHVQFYSQATNSSLPSY